MTQRVVGRHTRNRNVIKRASQNVVKNTHHDDRGKMQIGFYTSGVHGGSPLHYSLQRGFRNLGHSQEDWRPNKHYDITIIFNQSSHTTHYQYINLDKISGKIAFIDNSEYGYKYLHDGQEYYNTFAEGSMRHDTKNYNEQLKMKQFLDNKSFPYFIREYNKLVSYPNNYHPIDYPLHDHPRKHPNKEEYLSRPFEIFLCWGVNNSIRGDVAKILREKTDLSRSFIYVYTEPGNSRMPQHEYFNKMDQSKIGISADGYGSGGFREIETLARTVLLKQQNNMVLRNPLIPDVHYIEFTLDNLTEKINSCLVDPEKLFEIYRNGHDHCMNYYTAVGTARYVLDVLENHNWNKPTLLNF